MVRRKSKSTDGDDLFAAGVQNMGGATDEAKKKALDAALTDLTKRYGDGTIVRLGDAQHMLVDTIPSGSLTLDIALGVGGIPRGRIVEIYGPESSGKTTLCLHVVAEAQKRGGLTAFIDMEHALDPSYAGRIGVNIDTLYVSQPDTGEQALEITESLVRSGALDVIVIDSVAALVPRAEIEGEMGDSFVGLQARLMSQALRKLSGAIKQSNVAVIFTNQIREKVGVMYGCFSYQAPVLLADGTTMPIGRIVNQQLPVEVLSWNADTGCFEPKKVVRWFKNGIDVDQFSMSDNEIGQLRQEYITLIARYPDSRGFTKITSTPNHEIATPHGFISAEDIELDDEILCRHEMVVLSSDLQQLLLGSLLGDGSIRQEGYKTAIFREEHGEAQTEYAMWKADCFGSLVSKRYQTKGRVGFWTKHLSVFQSWKDRFYRKEGRYKHINEALLQRLTPFSLAIWYQDDGSLAKQVEGRRRNYIHLHTTDEEEKEMIQRVIEAKFGLKSTVRSRSNWTDIVFSGDDADAFEVLIAPYVHPSMAYKLRTHQEVGVALNSLEMCHWTEMIALPCEVYEIRRNMKLGKEAVRYNLQVEDNSTYIVGQHNIVHNSPETQPGGRALKFYATVRLDVRRVQAIKQGGETIGNRTKVRVTKNKVAAPFKETEFDIMFYEGGISKVGEILDLGAELGVVEKRGAFFRYNDGLLGQGRENAKVFLQENKVIADEIEDSIRANNNLPAVLSFAGPSAAAPVELDEDDE